MELWDKIILVVNMLWFIGGFITFALKPAQTCKSFRPDLDSHDERVTLVKATIPFLGGMNLALVFLSALTFYFCLYSSNPQLLLSTFFVSAVAHGTQFGYNVPHLKGLEGGAPWNVLKGQMKFIFIVDFVCMIANIIGLSLLAISL
jgi:hypothetical protein